MIPSPVYGNMSNEFKVPGLVPDLGAVSQEVEGVGN